MSTHEVAVAAFKSKVPSFEGVTLSIQPDADPKEVIASLHKCFNRLVDIRRIERITVYIAAEHVRVIAKRQLYKPKYKSLEAFLQAEIVERYQVSRSNVFNYYLILDQFPELTPSTANVLPQANLLAAARLSRDGVVDKAQSNKLIHDAKKLSMEEFLQAYPQAVHAGTGRSVIRIPTTAEYYKQFWKLVGNRDPLEFIFECAERCQDANIARSRASAKPKKRRAVAS